MFATDFLEESYTILNESLAEFMSDINNRFKNSAFSNDFLLSLLNRIDTYKIENKEDLTSGEEMSSIIDLEMNVLNVVLSQFKKEFEVDEPELDYVCQDLYSAKPITELIYDFFYNERRKYFINFITNEIISNKKLFVNKYKTSEIKKDIYYQNIRDTLKLKKPDNYSLIIFVDKICDDIIDDEDGYTLSEVVNGSEIQISDINTLNSFIGMSENNYGLYTKFITPEDRNGIYSEVRNKLVKILK